MRLSEKIYSNNKREFMRRMAWSEADYSDRLKCSYGSSLKYLYDMSSDIVHLPSGADKVGNLWEFLWGYKRDTHIVLPHCDYPEIGVDGVNISHLSDIKGNLNIDVTLDGHEVFIHVVPIGHTVEMKSFSSGCNNCNYVATVYVWETLQCRFLFSASDGVKEIYPEWYPCLIGSTFALCKSVKQGSNESLFGNGFKLYSSNYEPLLFLQVIAAASYEYLRGISGKNGEGSSDRSELEVNGVVHNFDTDYYDRVLSLNEYIKERSLVLAECSQHRVSPVKHPRAGHYRKCNNGNYSLVDGKYVEVPKGTGQFIYVKPTTVNANNGDKAVEQMVKFATEAIAAKG